MLRCILSLLFLTNNIHLLLGDSSEDDSKSDEGPVLKILGGHEAAPYSRPWIGQLFYNGGFTCGCSLISNQYALTAAHCVRDDDKKALKRYHIVFGGHSLNSGTSIGIKQIIKHSQYDNIAHYDAALLLFNGTISETDKISIIRLAEKSPDVDDKCIVNGWGSVKYHGSPASNVLKEINVNVLSPRVCSNKNSVIFDKNTMICVNEYAGSCSGDSGGPLLCSNNNKYREQHGIVSFGLSGCKTGITAYTDVSKILSWIYDQVESTTINLLNVMDGENIPTALVNQTLKNFNQKTFNILLSKVGTNWTSSEEQGSLLHIATKYGYYEATKALINKDPQLVNATDIDYWYPLHYVAWGGRCNIVCLLFSNGADVDALARFSDDDSTTSPYLSALYLAARYGHVECVRVLLDKGANISHQDLLGRTALHIASQEGHYDVVKALIKKNSQLINATGKYHQTPLHTAAWNGRCDIIKLLLDNGADVNALSKFTTDDSATSPHVSALYWATLNGNIECVKILLDKGANITHKTHGGLTALHVASEEGKYEAAKALIDKDPSLVNETDNYHWLPLHFAAWKGYCNIVKLLVKNGADVNALGKFTTDDSATSPHVSPLYLAASYGSVECIKTLLNKGAKIDHQDRFGRTALHIASQEDNYGIVKLLVDSGANVNIKNKDGKTAIKLATDKEIIDYFEKHTAHSAVLNELIAANVSINTTNEDQDTLLHIASREGKYNVANVTNNNGKTALKLTLLNLCFVLIRLINI